MLDLKPYLDAANAADQEVKRIAGEIDAHFQEGTDEGKAQALALRPALDEAQNKANEAAAMYESLKRAAQPSNLADFVPVSQTPPTPDADPAGVMTRHEFEALNPIEQRRYALSGGRVTD